MSEELTKKENVDEEKGNRRGFLSSIFGLATGLGIFGAIGKIFGKSSPKPGGSPMFLSPLAGDSSYTGTISLVAGSFAPQGWAYCRGQLLNIIEYQALFSLLGTTFGGDGHNTFGLPDLRGRVPIGAGQGIGLTPRIRGEYGGYETVQMTTDQLPSHTHAVKCDTAATTASASGNVPGTSRNSQYGPNLAGNMKDGMIVPTGSGQGHYNMQPYAVLDYIICLEGIYPPRP